MKEEIMKLELVVTKLKQIHSIFSCVCETYFNKDEPNIVELTEGYEQYTDIIYLVDEAIEQQSKTLSEIFENLLVASE